MHARFVLGCFFAGGGRVLGGRIGLVARFARVGDVQRINRRVSILRITNVVSAVTIGTARRDGRVGDVVSVDAALPLLGAVLVAISARHRLQRTVVVLAGLCVVRFEVGVTIDAN